MGEDMEELELQGILIARLSNLPPVSAADALRERNQRRKEKAPYGCKCPELEKALIARRDPLIDLSLAQYGMDADVLRGLYQRSLNGTGNAALDMGIRVAVLANRLAPSRFFETNPVMSAEELQRVAIEGAEEEIEALLTNPMTREYVGNLYKRQPPFDALDDSRFHALVCASIRNPRLTFDDSTEDGPDLHHMDISGGIYEMLSTVPVTRQWLWTLDHLLFNYAPASTHADKNALQVINRWRALDIKKILSEESETGSYTELKMSEEFCCRVAAMFGSYWEEGRSKVVGTPDSQEVVMRCTYYGNHAMKPDEMKTAHQKDGAAFTYAALHNSHFYWNRACRETLESMLLGDQIDLYSTFCKKMAEMNKNFDPKPVSDDIEVKEEPQDDPASQIRGSIGALEARLAAMQKDASTAKALGFWSLLILIAVLWHLA